MQVSDYTGFENLEVMREAVNYNRYLLRAIRRHVGAGTRALDFGAGTGEFAIPLQQLGAELTAVEPDRAMQRLLRDHGIRVCGSVGELPAGGFVVVYSLNVLEHIADDVSALRQLREVLDPGGTLLLYVPAFTMLYTSMDAKVGHVRRYTRASLRAAVAAAGFEVQRAEYADSLGFLAALAFKLFDRGKGEVNRTALKIYDRVIFPMSIALDAITKHWFGKNLWLVARK